MDDNEIVSILQAYRNGATADMLRSKSTHTWSVWWTVPPCNPSALEQAGQQMTRSRAEMVRHIRRARLRRQNERGMDVVVVTHLPAMTQDVYGLQTGQRITVGRILQDDALKALATSFVPVNAK